MAIAFAEVKSISRADKTKAGDYTSKGRSSVAASAYRAGLRLTDEITGAVHDYTARTKNGEVEALPVVLPDGEVSIERGALWNKVEAAETRKNSMLARELVIALPRETSPEANRRMAQSMAQKIADEFGVAVDVCIHAGRGKGKDHDGAENPHMHILFTTRRYKGGELGEKTRELNDKKTSSGHVEALRQFWEKTCNKELAAVGTEAIDMRSYARQGIDRIPQRHLGKNAFHHHRRTGENRLAARNATIVRANRRAEIAALRREADNREAQAQGFERLAKQLGDEEKTAAKAPADDRARGLHGAIAVFLNGGAETKEIRKAERAALLAALSACRTPETAANLGLADTHGNQLPHLLVATLRRLHGTMSTIDAAERREVQGVGALIGEVKASGIEAGFRFDVKARNAAGQTSTDVQNNGLAKPLPLPVRVVGGKAQKWRAGKARAGRSTCVKVTAARGGIRPPVVRTATRPTPPPKFMPKAIPSAGFPAGMRFASPAPQAAAPTTAAGAFPSAMGKAQAYDGGGQRAAGGMLPPPPGLPPAEAEAWLYLYKQACRVQQQADAEKRKMRC